MIEDILFFGISLGIIGFSYFFFFGKSKQTEQLLNQPVG